MISGGAERLSCEEERSEVVRTSQEVQVRCASLGSDYCTTETRSVNRPTCQCHPMWIVKDYTEYGVLGLFFFLFRLLTRSHASFELRLLSKLLRRTYTYVQYTK